jgi:hypothetical protein
VVLSSSAACSGVSCRDGSKTMLRVGDRGWWGRSYQPFFRMFAGPAGESPGFLTKMAMLVSMFSVTFSPCIHSLAKQVIISDTSIFEMAVIVSDRVIGRAYATRSATCVDNGVMAHSRSETRTTYATG